MSEGIATDEYVINGYAKLIAEQTSGVMGAIPEQFDVLLAREFFTLVENRLME